MNITSRQKDSVATRRLLAVVIVAALLVAAFAPTSTAQCFGPDGLDVGPCCAPVVPNLPNFPAVQMLSLGICWNNCLLAGTQGLLVEWTPPSQVFCGEYIAQFSVSDPLTGAAILSGLLTLDYTRTWIEDDAFGLPLQVWRFTVKADLSSVVGGFFTPCTTPSCLPPAGTQPTAFYYGYVDYASCSTAPGSWQNTLVLYHACDRFIHTPGLSSRPGSFHPDGSYAIVAPHTTTQPFVPSDVMASSGPLIAEGTRNVTPTSFCIVEDRVTGGSITKLAAGCICSLSLTPKHQTFRDFKGATLCSTGLPGSWSTLFVLFPTLPWIHLVGTSIGTWTGPVDYPGPERVWAEEGLFVISDACSGDFVEIKYGASTRGGFPIIPIGGALTTTELTDLVDNYSAPLSGPFPGPAFGSVMPTDHLIYVGHD